MNLQTAIETGRWELAALHLLLGVSEAMRAMPPGGTAELLMLIESGDRRGAK